MSLRVNRFENFTKCQKTWKNNPREKRKVLRNTVIAFLVLFASGFAVAQSVGPFKQMKGLYLDDVYLNLGAGYARADVTAGDFLAAGNQGLILTANDGRVYYFARGTNDATGHLAFKRSNGMLLQSIVGSQTGLRVDRFDTNSDSLQDLVISSFNYVYLFRNDTGGGASVPTFTKTDQISDFGSAAIGCGFNIDGVDGDELLVLHRVATNWKISSAPVSGGTINLAAREERIALPAGTFSDLTTFTYNGTSYLLARNTGGTVYAYTADGNGGLQRDTAAEAWFAGTSTVGDACMCLFEDTLGGAASAAPFGILTRSTGRSILYSWGAAAPGLVNPEEPYLNADFGNASSMTAGELAEDTTSTPHMILGYEDAAYRARINFWDIEGVDFGSDSVYTKSVADPDNGGNPMVMTLSSSLHNLGLSLWNQDGAVSYPSIFVGNYNGGVGHIKNSTADGSAVLRSGNFSVLKTGVDTNNTYEGLFLDSGDRYSSVAFGDLDGDGDSDAVTLGYAGRFRLYWNEGLPGGAPNFVRQTDSPFDTITIANRNPYFTMYDMDGDSDLDIMMAYPDGVVILWWNVGSFSAPAFSAANKQTLNDIVVHDTGSLYTAVIQVGDVDGDGWFDITSGDGKGGASVWINNASSDTDAPTAPASNPDCDFTAQARNANLVRLNWTPMVDNEAPSSGVGTGLDKYIITRYKETAVGSGTFNLDGTLAAAQYELQLPRSLQFDDGDVSEYSSYLYLLQGVDHASQVSTPGASVPGTINGSSIPAGYITATAETEGPIEVDTLSTDSPGPYVGEYFTATLTATYNYPDSTNASANVRIEKINGPANVTLYFRDGDQDKDVWVLDGESQVTVTVHATWTGDAPAEGYQLEYRFYVDQTVRVDSEIVLTSIDVVAPTEPVAAPVASLPANNNTSKTITITWDAFTDGGSGVDSHTVYRQVWADVVGGGQDYVDDGSFTGISGAATAYVDDSTEYGSRYRYAVSATDAMNNESIQTEYSNPLQTPLNVTVPPSPAPDVTGVSPRTNHITIQWLRSYPQSTGATAVWYQVYRQASGAATWGDPIRDNLTDTTYDDYGDVGQPQLPPGTYRYMVEAVDNLGNVAQGAPSSWVTLDDQVQLVSIEIIGPIEIEESSGIQMRCEASYDNGATLTVTSLCDWSENSSHSSITSGGYFSAFTVDQDTPVTITASYTDNGITRTDTHPITILDASASAIPGVISSVWYTQKTYNQERTAFSVKIDWYAPDEAEWYSVERKLDNGSWQRLVNTLYESAYDETLYDSGTYRYRVIAGNSVGLAEAWTESPSVTVELSGGGSSLEIPQNLQAVEVSGLQVELTWDALSNPDDHTGLRIYQKVVDESNPFGGTSYEVLKDVAVGETGTVLTTDWEGSAFVQSQTYIFLMRSVNGEDLSQYSNEVSLTMSGSGLETHTITATVGEGGAIAPAGEVSVLEGYNQSFAVTPDPGNEIESVTVDGEPVELEIVDGAFGETIHQYTFTAVDGDHTIHATFMVSDDEEAPEAPMNLYVASAEAGSLELRFSPAIDTGGSGLWRYHVYRSDTKSKTKAEVGTSTIPSFVDTGVVGGQAVYYAVTAEDYAGNVSAESETIGVQVPEADTEAPGLPVGLTATLIGGETVSVQLDWNLCVDTGSGVSVYEVYRQLSAPGSGDAPASVQRDTGWLDTSVENGETYTYWVRARDLAGNLSAPASVDVTIPLAGLEPASHTVYFPHLASGANWWTGFALVNTSGNPATVSFEFYSSEGTLLTTLADPTTLAAGEKMVTTIANLFDDDDPETENDVPAGASWWRVLSDQPLDGFELFGRPSNDGTTEEMVGVKIAKAAAERLLFPVINVDESEWTGIALVNTSGESDATVRFLAYGEDGALLATSDALVVPAMGKTVQLAESYFDGELPSGTGTLIMEADQPCIGFELFGYKDQSGLAGVSAVELFETEEMVAKRLLKAAADDSPRNLRVESLNGNVVTLAWEAPLVGSPVTYRVYTVKDPSDPFSEELLQEDFLGETAGAETSLELTLAPQTIYRVAVYAVDGGSESTESNDITFETEAELNTVGAYLYVIPRVDEAIGGETEVVAVNHSPVEAELDITIWHTGEEIPITLERVIPGNGSHTFSASELGLDQTGYVVDMVSTEPLTVCEVFRNDSLGYFDSLFAFVKGPSEVNVTHIATKTNIWHSHITLWNQSPYENEVTLYLYDAAGNLIDTTGTEDANPVTITIPAFGVASGEIHDFVTDDQNVRKIGWIRVVAQFAINGYFDYGFQDGSKVSAIELE